MSKKRRLIVPLCVALCSQGLFAQTSSKQVLGINEIFRLADENSQSIRTYNTGKEVANEALKAAKSERLPNIGVHYRSVILVMDTYWIVISKMAKTFRCLISAIISLWKHSK